MQPFQNAEEYGDPASIDALEWRGVQVKSPSYIGESVAIRILEQGIQTSGLEYFIARYPLGLIRFVDGIASNGRQILGIYYREERIIDLNILIVPSGEIFVPGQSFSVSEAGDSAEASLLRTFVHELGHHVQNSLTDAALSVLKRFTRPYITLDRSFEPTRPITTYAAENEREYFAESFAAFIFHRQALRGYDLNGYNMIEAVLTEMG